MGGQNGTPGRGLCHFIWEKNGVEALGAFTVNSYIEFSRSRYVLYVMMFTSAICACLKPKIHACLTNLKDMMDPKRRGGGMGAACCNIWHPSFKVAYRNHFLSTVF